MTKSAFKLWRADDFEVVKVIKEESSESIIWNIHLSHPLALICRDNELLDMYNLDTGTCLRSLKHESKVLCSTIHEGKIVVGCQYGLLVFWDIVKVLGIERKVIGQHHASAVLYEHSAAISDVHVDSNELITDDYDGIIILRKLRNYRRFGRMFRRGDPSSTDPKTILANLKSGDQSSLT